MLEGLFLATSGLLADEGWQSVLSNNLANADTPGFKSQTAVVGSFGTLLLGNGATGQAIGARSAGAALFETAPDLAQGSVLGTGDPLDVALQGPGFMAVQTPQGVFYTRDGALAVDSLGRLVTPGGALILGQNLQPIQAGQGAEISPDGTVTAGGRTVGKIGLFLPALGQLVDVGQSLFQAVGPVPVDRTTVLVPASLEASNVDPAATLAAMIRVLRQFEAGQTFIHQTTSTTDTFIQSAG